MSSLANKESIFESYSQVIEVSPDSIRPIYDRVLVREIPREEKEGSLFLPETSRDNKKIRTGIVVAVGLGDKAKEFIPDQKNVNSDGRPWIQYYAYEVCWCGHHESDHHEFCYQCDCKAFDGRAPMSVKPGDRVLYDRRREAEIFIDGEKYSLIHEEQSILAVIE